MRTLITLAAAALLVAGSASAEGKGKSGVFTSEGFGFNEGTGSFAGCQSSGQGRGGATRCRSGANSRFNTNTTVRGRGAINAGNFTAKNRRGTYQGGAGGVWGSEHDYLAVGTVSQGKETSSSFQGYQFEGKGRTRSNTKNRGRNFVRTRSGFRNK